MVMHLDVGRERSIKAINEAMTGDNTILLLAQKEAKTESPGAEDLYEVGTIANIKQMLKLPAGTIRVLVEGLSRARVKEYFLQEDSYFKAVIEEEERKGGRQSPKLKALMRHVLYQFEVYINLNKKISQETLTTVSEIEEPGMLSDIIASHLSLEPHKKQELLEAFSPKKSLERMAEILNEETELLKLEKKITLRVEKQMEKTQKEYYLRERVKAIQEELGDKDESTAEADEYREKIAEANLPEEVEKKALKEVARMEKMPPAVAEVSVIRTYLDWVLELPWSIQTEDRLDLNVVEQILDEDHYGLEKVKERIVEYLAVRRLTTKKKGSILCLIGPPGVGKTSLARSIARAMERNFVRISLGGVRDEAEIRGHRRTYVGALPGRIIQGMRQARSANPVFLLDEIDKMATDFRGDPSSAMLEVLDPEQNNTFSDHYIEVPYDLSRVMFITTANNRFNIPQPLLDRMESIHIAGYTEEEKVRIAQRHLFSKQLEENGLAEEHLHFSEGALRHIVREYTREAGVRNLEREMANVCRKTAKEVVKNETHCFTVTRSNLHKFLGVPRYRFGSAEKEDEIGVATGVGWTETGGDLLAIEVTLMKGRGKLILTGKLGDVMQESARAALSYIRSRASSLGIEEKFYEEYDIHIHVPEGAISKDGPSAGITMATAMVSALTGKPVSRQVAMTGEITLRGRVLAVGGTKEKILAAHRAGIRTIIIPEDNKKDLDEIPANVRRRIEFVPVENIQQVLDKALLRKEENEGEKLESEDENKENGVLKVS